MMEIRELPPPEPHLGRIKIYWEYNAEIRVVHRPVSDLLTSFDTTPGLPVPWWKQCWWRVCALWPIYRCRHDR